MNDAAETIKKVAFIGFAVVLLVCIAASFQYRNEILGGFALRGAQGRFEERVRQIVGPDATIEYRDRDERSAMLAVIVPSATYADRELQDRTADELWTAYAEEFAAGGMPVATIVLATAPGADRDSATYFEVGDLAARTGVAAPPLHAMYAEKGYFDASRESAPPDDATDPAADEQ